MYEDHPVMVAMARQLLDLERMYRLEPTEFNRYRLVQLEQRRALWLTVPQT